MFHLTQLTVGSSALQANHADFATPLGGNTIYYNTGEFNQESSYKLLVANLIHEFIHAVGGPDGKGLNDPQAAAALGGVDISNGSNAISRKIEKDYTGGTGISGFFGFGGLKNA